jgi:hypothetical protein
MPPQNPDCQSLRQEYEALKSLKQEFDLEYEKAILDKTSPQEAASALSRAKELKRELEKGMEALSAKLWPYEKILPREQIEKQYNFQIGVLTRLLSQVGLLKELEGGKKGIIGIDKKPHPFPTLKEIMKQMKENRDLLKTKTEQGFQKLLITPFGMKLDDLIEIYKQVILKHHKEGKLFATKKDPDDALEELVPLELDESQPLWTWEKYKNADINEELVYYPEQFTKNNHGGKTKAEILEQNPNRGIEAHLIEDLPNIPRQGKGKTKAKRKQLEAGQTPSKYLKTLQTAKTNTKSEYHGEEGMTPEAQIMDAIYTLEETNQVIDDFQGNGSISYQLAAYFKSSGFVPYAYWFRVDRRADLGGVDPGFPFDVFGVRPAVRVPKLKL